MPDPGVKETGAKETAAKEAGAKKMGPKETAAKETAAPATVKFKLNERELEAPAGMNLIEVAKQHGVEIPFYCYHPGLTPAGNCRMCLVEASNSKKPITACTTPVSEGLAVLTDSPGVKRAREAVLELMLVNHPLDCPICDKSGECLLQDHTFNHGKDHSRMVEPKVLKPTKDLGKEITIWGNRCIVCTRCVRFCDEIAGTGELCVVQRGDHSVVDVFPGFPLQNNLSGNVVDICPVGALISREFLYRARVWYQQRTESICTSCARGCNIHIETLANKITRLVPRHNAAVNDYWMCDHGRHDHQYVLGERRVLHYRPGGRGEEAGRALASGLGAAVKAHGPGAAAALGSAFQTLEEVFLLRRLLEALGAPRSSVAAIARAAGEEEVFRSGFRIAADKNPNRRGVQALLGNDAFGSGLEAVVDGVASGRVRALVVVSDRPHFLLGQGPLEDRLLEVLPRLDFLAVFLLENGAALPEAALVLPATAFSEKDGTMVNDDGRVQRLRPATQLPRGIRPEGDVLQEALRSLGAWPKQAPPAAVFQELAAELGLGGSTHRQVGNQGVPMGESAMPPPKAGASSPRRKKQDRG
jgi:NADH-quinone oxidoreductase subunit G